MRLHTVPKFTPFPFSFWHVLVIIVTVTGGVRIMSVTFWIIMLVFVLFLTAIFTAGYNDDKTNGL